MLRWATLASAIWVTFACGSSSEQTTGAGGTAGDAGAADDTGAGGSAAGSETGGGTGGGGGSTSAGTGTGGGEDVPVCSGGLPRDGTSCSPNGRKCQTPGSPCGSIYTCQNGAWTSETVCPPVQECPADVPEQGQACTANNPSIGLNCQFNSACGNVAANCNSGRWELNPFPVTECNALCDNVCQSLSECGITWARDCAALCKLAYLCPGESPGQDAAICTGEDERLSGLTCADLCSAVTDSGEATAFGVDCDLMPQ